MIAIIGSGSHLVPAILNTRPNENYLLIGRSDISKALYENFSLRWKYSNYLDFEQTSENIRASGADQIIWLGSPFFRDFLVNQETVVVKSALETGVHFPIEVVKRILPTMIQNRYGRFIFIGSHLAKLGDRGSILYSLTKSAQAALSRGIALEYGRFNIESNVLSLGALESGFAQDLSEARKVEYLERTARDSLISPDEVARAIHSLLQGSGISGQEIQIDAGFR